MKHLDCFVSPSFILRYCKSF
ncbi:unnamed protein product [Spirodela intermedia]|uniref:Uncharacterized protein n=1 Tax=Spirodela intermedia TaxID=51605 RepID=A0A7I8L3K8_SPIIN|nr:unnamed protein product [Spirodela intermedia]